MYQESSHLLSPALRNIQMIPIQCILSEALQNLPINPQKTPKYPIYYRKIAIYIYIPIHHPTGLKKWISKKIFLGSQKNMKNYAIDILKNRNRNIFYPRLPRSIVNLPMREKKIQFRINFGIEIKKELENISFHRNLIAVFSSWLLFLQKFIDISLYKTIDDDKLTATEKFSFLFFSLLFDDQVNCRLSAYVTLLNVFLLLDISHLSFLCLHRKEK